MIDRKWRYRSLAGAALLACTVGQASAQTPAKAPAPPEAKAPAAAAKPPAVVNGEAITQAELDLAIKQVGPGPLELPEAKRQEMHKEILQFLIDDKLLSQFLAKSAPAVAPAEVDKKVTELTERLKKDGKTLTDLLRDSNQTEATLRADILHRLQWEAYARTKITDEVAERYHKEYKDFFDRNTVKVSHIVLRVAPNASEADKTAARKKLEGLRAQIAENKLDFAAAAKEHSQCPSAAGGGDIGFIPRKWVVEENFAKAAFALQVGQVSDIVQTGYGLHLIKVTERKAGTPTEFAKIKEDVREVSMMEYRQNVLTYLHKNGTIEINLP
jgi:peptidyl-prolyl cis-trans isomerase C